MEFLLMPTVVHFLVKQCEKVPVSLWMKRDRSAHNFVLSSGTRDFLFTPTPNNLKLCKHSAQMSFNNIAALSIIYSKEPSVEMEFFGQMYPTVNDKYH